MNCKYPKIEKFKFPTIVMKKITTFLWKIDELRIIKKLIVGCEYFREDRYYQRSCGDPGHHDFINLSKIFRKNISKSNNHLPIELNSLD
jgi:hypothetical protein